MRATATNRAHLPANTLLLLQYIDIASPCNGALRLARIDPVNYDLVSLPVGPEDFRISTFQDVWKIANPREWSTQLLGDRHEIIQIFLPEDVTANRIPTGADAGLVVQGVSRHDSAVQTTVRFVLHEVANGFARVEGGGSHRIADYTWVVFPNSRRKPPTTLVLEKYAERIGDLDESLLVEFAHQYVRAYGKQFNVALPDPSDVDFDTDD